MVTSTIIDATQSAKNIDEQVRGATEPLYRLDLERLNQLKPDVVVTQTVCRVCAIDGRDLEHEELPGYLVAMDATAFDALPNDFLKLGEAIGREAQAEQLIADWQHRTDQIPEAPQDRPRIAFLEWLDPPYSPGHWVTDMIEKAGGIDVLGEPGQPARRLAWEDIWSADPDIVIGAPCGYSPQEINGMVGEDIVPSGARFDRPGPGLIDGLEWLSELVHGHEPGN